MNPIYFKNGRETNKAWGEVIEEETDEMAEESPVIIAGSEQKRGHQLHRMEVLKRLINAGERIVFQKDVHKIIEPIDDKKPVKPEDCVMNPTISGGMYNLKVADEKKFTSSQMKNMCPFKKDAVGRVSENDILIANNEEINATIAKIDELMNDSLNPRKPGV